MTIDGPDGASSSTERNIPEMTEITPTKVVINAICPGELANLLEVAAGIINIAVIRSKPIIWSDTATTIVKTMVNNKLI